MLLSKRLVVIYKDDVGNRTDAYNTGGQPNINSIDLTWQRWPPPTSVPLEPFLHRHFAHTSSRGHNFRQTCEIPQPRNFSKPISSTLSTSMESSTVKSKLSFLLSFAMRKSSKFLKFGTGEDDKGIHEDFYSVFIVRYNSRGMNWTLEYFKEDKNA